MTKIERQKNLILHLVEAEKLRHKKKLEVLDWELAKVQANCKHPHLEMHPCAAGGRTEDECKICGKWI